MTPRSIVTADLAPLAAARRYDGLSLLEARGRFFAEQGIPADGGYEAPTIPVVVLGRFHVFNLPNTESRKRAVRFHDLHHVLTGYQTDWPGEGRISAWELATGCRDHWAAWVLNLNGLLIGLVLDPVGTLRAFSRGRRSTNLYAEAFGPALLSRPVSEVRVALGLEAEGGPLDGGGALALVGWLGVALALAVVELAPLGLLTLGLWAWLT
jgi:hypothetical protein